MRFQLRSWLPVLLLTALLGFPGAAVVCAQSQTPTTQASSASHAPAQSHDNGETSEFRHSPQVEAVGRKLHISTEAAAQIFEGINSTVLIGTILFFLLKVLPKAIRTRTANIQKQLIDARSATEIANERLAAVEAKLAKLGEDIEAIRQQTEREMQEDEKRIKQSLEEERERIVKSAEQEIASAGAAAQRELKRFAAGLAVDQAARKIQLTVESDRELVERFGREIVGRFGGRN